MYVLQAHAHRRVRHMRLELSIRSNVSNTSSGCPFFSLHVFPSIFPSPSSCYRLYHLSSVLSLSHSFLLPGDICCPKTICLSPLSGRPLCPLPSAKGIFCRRFMCLTQSILHACFQLPTSSPCIPLLSLLAV